MDSSTKKITKRRGATDAQSKTVAEFFAGIGLMRIGLEEEGWRVTFANDIAADKREMYLACFPTAGDHFLLQDIHTLSPSDMPQVTLATASFPCNDLSLAGSRSGLCGEQSSAFWGFIRILRELRDQKPRIVLLENVAGFLTSRGGDDFLSALKALNGLGYAVDAFMIDAERFLPQSRVRLFVVGVHQHISHGCRASEDRAFYESDVRPKALADFIFGHPEIRWRIRELPPLPKRTRMLEELLEILPDDSPFWWKEDRVEYLLNQMSPKHSKELRRMIGLCKWSYGTVFRRVRKGVSMAELRTDGVAGCLRTPRGGSGRQILVIAGHGSVKVRLLTPRECARLMGADAFPLAVPMNQAYFGFGDAVCVPVIKWIARNYLNPEFVELATQRAVANG